MLKISCAGRLGLSLAISPQFTFEMCVAAQNRENLLKPPIYEVQGHPMLTFVRSSSLVLAIITACLCLSATVSTLVKPKTVKEYLFKGVPLFHALVREESPHPAA